MNKSIQTVVKALFGPPFINGGEIDEPTEHVFHHFLNMFKEDPILLDSLNEVLDAIHLKEETRELIMKFIAKPKINRPLNLDKYLQYLNMHLDFPIWEINDNNVFVELVVIIFKNMNLLDTFQISEKQFVEFMYDIKNHYNEDIHYHNFRHCFDVIYTSYIFLIKSSMCKLLQPIDKFSLLIAAIIHDIEHNGTSNTFHIVTRSDLAMLYNDISVLENHHCSVGFRLIAKHNILKNLTKEEYTYLRKVVIDSVLYTDSSRYDMLVRNLDYMINNFDITKEDIRHLLVCLLLKCSDVSNPVKPFPIAKLWCEAVQQEFFGQGDKEREYGIEISQNMDRNSPPEMDKFQIEFIEQLVLPLYKKLSTVIPEFSVYVEKLKENRENWANISKRNKSDVK